jgi:hypothetical protein
VGLGSFLEDLGGKLTERWAANLVTPAFLFWLGGAAAWVYRHGWDPRLRRVVDPSQVGSFSLIAGGLVVLLVSATLAQRCAPAVIRFLEGYWPRSLSSLRSALVHLHEGKQALQEERFQVLAAQVEGGRISPRLREEYVRLDSLLRRIPDVPGERMPTRLGNILRSAENTSSDKYGLDSIKCWPRLWLLLPEGVKADISESRSGLNAGAVAWLWSVLFIVWTVWAWWALVAGVICAIVSYAWMVNAAQTYGDLIESVYDVYRGELYKALRCRLPAILTDEKRSGRALTEHLWLGVEIPVEFALPLADKAKEVESRPG